MASHCGACCSHDSFLTSDAHSTEIFTSFPASCVKTVVFPNKALALVYLCAMVVHLVTFDLSLFDCILPLIFSSITLEPKWSLDTLKKSMLTLRCLLSFYSTPRVFIKFYVLLSSPLLLPLSQMLAMSQAPMPPLVWFFIPTHLS